jgi:molybdopterin molybdotransferase
MAQLGKGIFAAGEASMTVGEAASLVLARIPCVDGAERVPIVEAEGRVLAEDLVAPIDLPSFDNAAVDGYAVRFADLATSAETILPVGGRIAAGGEPAPGDLSGTAVRIFTGAAMPDGMDTVFMQEDCRACDDGSVVLPPGLVRGANRRLAGEDIRRGDVALARGRSLAPEDIGLAAALGVPHLDVRRQLHAAIFSTGDEIVAPGTALLPPKVFDANRFLLQALLRRLGVAVTDLGILADDPTQIGSALRAAAASHDLVLTSGGVSTGEEDHVKAALADQGSLVFWRLALKPGRPVAMGIIEGTPFVGLPGNPVAVFVTFVAVVRPLIAALSGATFEPARSLPVTSGFSYKKKAGRREYVRVSLRADESGAWIADKYPVEGAAVLTSLTRTHGLVELPEDVTSVQPGDTVAYVDYGLIR